MWGQNNIAASGGAEPRIVARMATVTAAQPLSRYALGVSRWLSCLVHTVTCGDTFIHSHRGEAVTEVGACPGRWHSLSLHPSKAEPTLPLESGAKGSANHVLSLSRVPVCDIRR